MAISKEPCKGIRLGDIAENFSTARSEYVLIFRKMAVLDGCDRGQLWDSIGAKYPDYQILPDTNYVRHIKQNLVASIYTVAKSAKLQVTSEEDKDIIENVNLALEHIWDTENVGMVQMQAGHNAALQNIGITQVGWDADAVHNRKNYNGEVTLKNISPLNYMRDPYASSLDTAAYCIVWEDLHKTAIMANPMYTEAFKKFLADKQSTAEEAGPSYNRSDRADPTKNSDYYKVIMHWVRYIDKDEVKVAEIHTINNSYELYRNEDIKPSCFPFVELFCNTPNGDIIGTSEPAAVLNNTIAYNILMSVMLTAEYKNQRPPRFVNAQSGLNIAAFAKYGNDADKTFIVNGDASRAIHYHQFPTGSQNASMFQNFLTRDVQTISGVDERYTGRDTGSILTTGGIENMLTRVTLLDTPKIINYEMYTKNLTQLILKNFVEFSLKRTYVRKNPNNGALEEYEVDYNALKLPGLMSYAINISTELPKNKQRVAAVANVIMEKQMQYGASNNSGIELMTPEEWLRHQDIPFKEEMLSRMGVQRMADIAGDVAQNLFDYAQLVKTGFPMEDAITAIAQNKMSSQRGEDPVVPIPDAPYDLMGEEDIMMDPLMTEQLDPLMAEQGPPEMVQEPLLPEEYPMI